jgi:hypothetical protein
LKILLDSLITFTKYNTNLYIAMNIRLQQNETFTCYWTQLKSPWYNPTLSNRKPIAFLKSKLSPQERVLSSALEARPGNPIHVHHHKKVTVENHHAATILLIMFIVLAVVV